MPFFSKLFFKSPKSQKVKPSDPLIPILEKIQGNPFFSNLELQLTTSAEKIQLSDIDLPSIIDNIKEKMNELDHQMEMLYLDSSIYAQYIAQCKKIAAMPPATIITTYEQYNIQKDFTSLELQWKLMNILIKAVASMTDIDTPEQSLEFDEYVCVLKDVYLLKQEVDALMPEFLIVETTLKTDIATYTQAINEASAKYKLSPDWSGKKQPLMNYGVGLQTRRDDFIKREDIINQKITILSEKDRDVTVLFLKLMPFILKILEHLLLQQKQDVSIIQAQQNLTFLYEESQQLLQLLEALL